MTSFFLTTLLLAWMLMASTITTHAFVVTPSAKARPSTTRIFLEDWVADMIDGEIYRQGHLKEFEQEWMEKNRGAMLKSVNKGDDGGSASNLMLTDDAAEEFRQLRKDRILAANDPMRYCADRCVSTGSCEVFEDIFDFTPEQVQSFCTDCVLSDGEEPCELPDAFF